MAKWLEELPEKIREIKENNNGKIFEFFFQDESRYGQKTIYTGIWAIKGSNVEFENQNGFLNSWIYGLVNPNSGEHFGLILPSLNGENMQIFLDEFSKTIPENKHIIMRQFKNLSKFSCKKLIKTKTYIKIKAIKKIHSIFHKFMRFYLNFFHAELFF